MTNRMVGSVLTLVILLFNVEAAVAQTYTQMQWGMNKGVTPYTFGANINGTWRDFGTVSATGVWSIPASNIANVLPQVANTTALKATPGAFAGQSVYKAGFATANDGGGATYSWATSACSINGGLGDDGGQIPATGGCWKIVSSPAGVDGRAWGVLPLTNVNTKLQAAINWGCDNHIPVLIPNLSVSVGPYYVSTQINIGNGTASSYSTSCKDFSLIITQPSYEYFLGNAFAFQWTGSIGDNTVFSVNGPIQSVTVKGLSIICNGGCTTGLRVITALNSRFEDLAVWGNIGTAFDITTWGDDLIPAGSGMEGSRFSNILAAGPYIGATVPGMPYNRGSGMRVGGSCTTICNSAVIANQFENITLNYAANKASSFGIEFGFANMNTFTNLRISPFPGTSGSGQAIQITPPPGNTTFPTNNMLLHPLIEGGVDAASTWTGTVGFHMLGWSTVHNAFPSGTSPLLYTGTDDKGSIYNATSITTDLASTTLTTPATPSTYNYKLKAAGNDYFGIGVASGGDSYIQSWSAATLRLNAQGNPIALGNSTSTVGVNGLLKLRPSTVAVGLPTCNAGAAGSVIYVSDSSVTTGPISGGGANKVIALCDGVNWTAH